MTTEQIIIQRAIEKNKRESVEYARAEFTPFRAELILPATGEIITEGLTMISLGSCFYFISNNMQQAYEGFWDVNASRYVGFQLTVPELYKRIKAAAEARRESLLEHYNRLQSAADKAWDEYEQALEDAEMWQ